VKFRLNSCLYPSLANMAASSSLARPLGSTCDVRRSFSTFGSAIVDWLGARRRQTRETIQGNIWQAILIVHLPNRSAVLLTESRPQLPFSGRALSEVSPGRHTQYSRHEGVNWRGCVQR
jgi:hypothetical protein